jgi:hypothetical protein
MAWVLFNGGKPKNIEKQANALKKKNPIQINSMLK